MSWTYSQSTGQLSENGIQVGVGYSGTGTGRNNPAEEAVPRTGPIPSGKYSIGPPHDTDTHGPYVMSLTPVGHNALGRSGFLMHGDNVRHDASLGCIILGPQIRHRVGTSGDKDLEVVH